jgi:hypothetical protein
MKALFLFLTICFSCSISAQNWAPFPAEPNIQWSVDNAWKTGSDCWVSEHYDYVLGDSMEFNGHTYYAITYTGTSWSQYIFNQSIEHPCNIWPPEPISGTRGYLRAENGVCYQGWQGGEFVLYNFNLVAGDTVYFESMSPILYSDAIIDSVDQVLIGETLRTRLWVSDDFMQPIWIVEGVGHQFGLFEPIYQFENSSSLNCYWENGAPVLPNSSHCGYLSVANNSAANIQISPNPSTGIFRIETAQKSTIKIYDLYGRLVLQDLLNGSSEIDISSEPSGVYLIMVENEQGLSTTKLVKH